ncbi:MAG: AraC family transcriptional regulator [Verrucomicrobiota bacterium]
MSKENISTAPKSNDRLKMSYLYSGTAVYQPGEVLGPRILEDFEAVMIIDGHPRYETQQGKFHLEPGSIMIGRPGTRETYFWDTENQTRHAYFHFGLEEIPSDWPDPADWPDCQLDPERGVGELFRHIVERAARHSDWPTKRPAVSDNRIFEAFLELYINPDGSSGEESAPHEFSEPVRRAAKYVRERLDEPFFRPFSLADLAQAANVSPAHLCRVFSKELGIPPLKACRLMQFQLAIPLLARSNLGIKAIAERCGFPDQLHFSRSFTRTFGDSPSQLRKKMQNGTPPPHPLPHSYLFMPRLHW